MQCFYALIILLSTFLHSTFGMKSPSRHSGGPKSSKMANDYLNDYQKNFNKAHKLQIKYERLALKSLPNGGVEAVPHNNPRRLRVFKEMQGYAKKAHEAFQKKLDIEQPSGKSKEQQLAKAMAYRRPTKSEIDQSRRESPSSSEGSRQRGNESPRKRRRLNSPAHPFEPSEQRQTVKKSGRTYRRPELRMPPPLAASSKEPTPEVQQINQGPRRSSRKRKRAKASRASFQRS